jgi:hypothetical protein
MHTGDKADRPVKVVAKVDKVEKVDKPDKMDKLRKEALQVAKEIVVKFIETGKISTSNFHQVFPAIYFDVLRTITSDPDAEAGRPEGREGAESA